MLIRYYTIITDGRKGENPEGHEHLFCTSVIVDTGDMVFSARDMETMGCGMYYPINKLLEPYYMYIDPGGPIPYRLDKHNGEICDDLNEVPHIKVESKTGKKDDAICKLTDRKDLTIHKYEGMILTVDGKKELVQ